MDRDSPIDMPNLRDKQRDKAEAKAGQQSPIEPKKPGVEEQSTKSPEDLLLNDFHDRPLYLFNRSLRWRWLEHLCLLVIRHRWCIGWRWISVGVIASRWVQIGGRFNPFPTDRMI